MNGFGRTPLTKKEQFINALKYGFATVFAHPVLLLKAALVVLLSFGIIFAGSLLMLMFVGVAFYASLVQQAPLTTSVTVLVLTTVASIVGLIVSAVSAWAGVVRFAFQLHDQGHANLKTLFSGFNYVLRFIGLAFLMLLIFGGITAIAGMTWMQTDMPLTRESLQILLANLSAMNIVHILILTISALVLFFLGYRLSYAWYALAVENVTPVGSLKISWHLTQGWVLLLFLLTLVTSLPTSIFSALIEPLSVWLLNQQTNIFFVLAVLVQLAALLVGFICTIAGIFARVRLYRLLRAQR